MNMPKMAALTLVCDTCEAANAMGAVMTDRLDLDAAMAPAFATIATPHA